MDLLNLAILSLYMHMDKPQNEGQSPSHGPWDFVRYETVRYRGSTVLYS